MTKTAMGARAVGSRLLVLVCLTIGGCVSLNEPVTLPAVVPTNPALEVVGARGPLTQRQANAVLAPLKLASPDAGVMKMHLAIEQAVAGTPLIAGNRTHLLKDGWQTFPAMFAAIRAATRSVYLEYYIFDNVECGGMHLSDLLLQKRAAGVEIAVIYDSFGSSATSSAILDTLREAGVQLIAFNPLNPLKARFHWSINDRDHRKMLIADERVAIIGGINMATDYENGPPHGSEPEPASNGQPAPYWRDTDLKIEGPAVAALVKVYRDHWQQQGGAPLAAASEPGTDAPRAPGTDIIRIISSSPDALAPRYYATVLSAINTAQRSVRLTTGYFVPTRQERGALKAAARRGVDVELLLPSQSDSPASLAVQRSSYGDLMKAGVRVFERAGVILHSKAIVVDGVWSVIGSSNFDHRSVLFNDEVDAVVLGTETAGGLEALFRSDLESARRIDRADWEHRGASERIKELVYRATTAFL